MIELIQESQSSSPNVWAVLQTIVTVAGSSFAVWLAHKANTRKLGDKLDEVHTCVNGNLTLERDRATRYADRLRQHGIDPDETAE